MSAVNRILLLNKPHGTLSKFQDEQGRPTLASLVDLPGVYPVGRLDADSEGLLLLTDRKSLVEPLLLPGAKDKRYLVCVEGRPDESALQRLRDGVVLKDGSTLPARVREVGEPSWLWERVPPIRFRKSVPTAWLELVISEGRNRQVRRMTAAVGLPTLRLIRTGFGPLSLDGIAPGGWRDASPEEARWLLEWEARFVQQKRRRSGPPQSARPARSAEKPAASSKSRKVAKSSKKRRRPPRPRS